MKHPLRRLPIMQTVQRSVRSGILRPLRKVGLLAAEHWPWLVRVEIANGREMYVDLRSGIGRGLFMKGEFDPAVFTPLRNALRPGGTFLDLGANVGYYSLLALNSVGLSGQVHAFEIDPRPLRCLRETVRKGAISNLIIHETAIGQIDGIANFTPHAEPGQSSVSAAGHGLSVPMTTLDSWRAASGVRNIQAIKLDIEGGELWALQGAEKLLRDERPVLVCEVFEVLAARSGYGQADLTAFLREHGYRIQSVEEAVSPTIVAVPE